MSTIKKIFTLAVVLLLLIAAVAISSLNADAITLNLYWYQLSLPLGFMLLLFVALGLLVGLVVGWLFWTWPTSRQKLYWEREYFKLKQATEQNQQAAQPSADGQHPVAKIP